MSIDEKVWLEKLENLVSKRIKTNHQYGTYKLKEKILFDLVNNGYDKWMVEDVINHSTFGDNSNLLQKEYNKLCTKLSKKFSGSELRYQVRNKLLSKGFSYEEVDTIIEQ